MKKILVQLIIIGIFLTFVQVIQAKEFHLTVLPSAYEIMSKKNKEITLPYAFVNLGDPDVFNLKIYRLIPRNSSGANTLLPYEQTESGIAFRIDGTVRTLGTPFFLKTKVCRLQTRLFLIVNLCSYYNIFTPNLFKIFATLNSGKPIILLKSPVTLSINTAPKPCTAKAPALSNDSPCFM